MCITCVLHVYKVEPLVYVDRCAGRRSMYVRYATYWYMSLPIVPPYERTKRALKYPRDQEYSAAVVYPKGTGNNGRTTTLLSCTGAAVGAG